MYFSKGSESTENTLASVRAYPGSLLSFPKQGPGFKPRKKDTETPVAVTAPKFFLAVKLQTIYAITSKQGVKVQAPEKKGTSTKLHLQPRPPHTTESWSEDAVLRCAMRVTSLPLPPRRASLNNAIVSGSLWPPEAAQALMFASVSLWSQLVAAARRWEAVTE